VTDQRSLERRLADFYEEEAAQRAPDRVLDALLSSVDDAAQRRPLIPVWWDGPRALRFAALAAAVVLAVGVSTSAFLRTDPAPGQVTTSSPPETPSGSVAPPLTATFTSTYHGITVDYPAAWTVEPATEPWRFSLIQDATAFADLIVEKPDDSMFIALASQRLSGQTGETWAADYLASMAGLECDPIEPTTIDGAPGLIALGCFHAFAWLDGRGYLIWLYRSDDRAFFDAILATVRLHPEDAIDDTAAPSP
jgi:hypothetical protein